MSRTGLQRNRFETEVTQILQRGTLEDLERLIKRWPKDARTVAPALSIVLAYIGSLPLPCPPASGVHYDWKSTNALRAEACLKMVLKTSTNIKMAPWDAFYNDALKAVQPNINSLFSWLAFYARESSDKIQIALVGLSLEVLLDLGHSYPEMDLPYESAMDLALDLWIALPLRFRTIPSLLGTYESWIRPAANPLLAAMRRDETSRILIAKVQQTLSKSRNKRLVYAFIWHCRHWTTLPFGESNLQRARESVLARFIAIVIAAFDIARKAPRFYQALIECQFGPIVLDMGRALSDSFSGTTGMPIAVNVAAQLPPRGNDLLAFEVLHFIPAMLSRGYLEVLAQDISETPSPAMHPNGGTMQLVHELFVSCWHPRLCKAVKAAIPSIASSILQTLASHPDAYTRNTWTEFVEAIEMYSEVHEMGPQSGRVPICDNLKHQQRNTPAEDIDGRQCQSCRTTVYCSAHCQREDWKALHRVECAQKRQYRIDLKLHNGWISHSVRLQLMQLSGTILEEAIGKTPGFLEKADSHVGLDTFQCPPAWQVVSLDELAGLCFEETHPTWYEDRVQGLITNTRNCNNVRLVACHSIFGQFQVYSLATFRIQSKGKEDGIPSDSGGVQIGCTPLNIYVSVVERLPNVKTASQ